MKTFISFVVVGVLFVVLFVAVNEGLERQARHECMIQENKARIYPLYWVNETVYDMCRDQFNITIDAEVRILGYVKQ